MIQWWKILAGCQYESAHKDAVIAQIEAARAKERLAQSLAQVKAVDDARIEEQRRINDLMGVANEAKNQADTARADARAAGAVADRLRQRVAALLRERDAAIGPAAASGSPPAADPNLVLTDVFGRLAGRATDLARFADEAHISGRACERSFSAMNPSDNKKTAP